jgi:ferredoxin
MTMTMTTVTMTTNRAQPFRHAIPRTRKLRQFIENLRTTSANLLHHQPHHRLHDWNKNNSTLPLLHFGSVPRSLTRVHPLSITSKYFSPRRQRQQQCAYRVFSTSSPSPEEQNAIDFLIKIGHDQPNIAQSVVEALKQSGLSGAALLPMVKSMAGRWEVGEDAGLESLIEAIRVNQLKEEGRTKIKLLVIPANAWKSSEEDAVDYGDIDETEEEYQAALKRAFPVEALTGLTLTDVAKFGDGPGAAHLGESIECACAGIMACSTCHVIIDPQWFDNGIIEEPSESELDMLDLAYAPRRTSRLACQIVLEEAMDGMVIRLPKSSNNLMDFIPFSE